MKPTRTNSTEAAYQKRASLLIERFAVECCISDWSDIQPIDIARWAIHKRTSLRPASWRQYRSALAYHFQQLGVDRGNIHAYDDAIQLLQNAGSEKCLRGKDVPRRTSSSKKRSLTQSELEAITCYLDQHKTRWSLTTALWLQSAVLTGLRPAEWKSARLELLTTGKYELILLNAKNSNGRGNGDARTLLLGDMRQEDVKTIQTHIDFVCAVVSRNFWERYYRECRKTLYRATRALWPSRDSYPTLYTGRHQFSANAKKTGFSKAEVAALLGHGSTETAGIHYGKKRSGVVGMTISPSQGDVARLQINQPNVLKN